MLILLLVFSTISCDENSRRGENPNASATQPTSEPVGNPNASTSQPTSEPVGNPNAITPQANSRNSGFQLLPTLVSTFILALIILVGGFIGYEKLRFLVRQENRKNRELYNSSSRKIDELKGHLSRLNLHNQNLANKVKQLEQQISSSNSQSSFSSSKSQDKQQYQIRDEIDYSNYPIYSQPAPVVQRDPYQEVITAFNTQDTNFFRQNTYYLALDESTVGGETSAGARRIVKFIDIDNPRDALCLAVNVNFEYLLLPNFFSPYYGSLDQWLSDNIDIFDYQGNGQGVELIRPGKVQYSQSENGIWNLIEPVRLQLI